MIFYNGFLRTPYTPNSNSVCDCGEFFVRSNEIAFPAIFGLAVRLCHMAQNYALNLSIAQRQRLKILLLFLFLRKKIKFVVLLLDVIYNVTTWISN
jgi:hypothetical protein